MIEILHVSKSYNKGAVRAVDDLTLTVPPGEIFGFLGPNGAGKTTTIKMIVGILKPDGGTIRIGGLDNRLEALRTKAMTAYVPDEPEIYERLKGIEYLNFIGDVYGVSASDRRSRVARWLAAFELSRAAGDPIQTYSHGMRQKIILTAALMVKPRVLVLDEPMVGLDPRSSHLLKEALRAHCDEGGTLFFSTHIMEVAERLCDRIGIIHKGRLATIGTMAELQAQAKDKASLENIFLELTEK
ncbi:MAG: 3-dehydroquinate dehydratase [Candidatus Aminicenantes bacterium RBG_13_59_9]|jgi:ABC-2 type transport system ATP-binding protein|nr:MAG: 3-dehydroquinate dehydratase [Candidatus Aminicenantes bacterium RBG_13_59_9]